MGLRIGTNVSALNAVRHLHRSSKQTAESVQALASGSRFVSAGTDAAGFAVSEGLRGQISGLRQAQENANNAISLVNVAEGSLNEQNNILVRMRELAVQAASDNFSDTEREFLNEEFTQLQQELTRIAKTTRFGRKELLTGSGERFEFQVGPGSGPENQINFTLDSDTSGETLDVNDLEVDSQSGARNSLDPIDEALQKIAGTRSKFGAIQSRLETASNHLLGQVANIEEARSKIADTDIAAEISRLTTERVKQEVGLAVLAQANLRPSRALLLLD